MLKKFAIAGLVSSLVLVAAHAQDTTLFNSLGGRPAGSDSIYAVGPIGASFSTGGSLLDLVSVVVDLNDGGATGSGTTTVGLFSNNPGTAGGPFPGTLLTTIGSVNDSQLSGSFQDYTLTLPDPYALATDATYWITLTSTSSSAAQWAYTFSASGPGVASEYYNNSDGTSPNSSGPYSMAVIAAPVPEPSSIALFGFGAAALFWLRRLATAR